MTHQNKSLLPGALALLAVLGCTEDDPAETSRVAATDAVAVAGDIVPSELFERDTTVDIDEALASAAMPAAPTMPLREHEVPELRQYKRTNIFVPAGSEAGRVVIPIDNAADAKVLILGRIQTPDLEERDRLNEEVLRDLRFLSPDGDVLNVRGTNPDASPEPETSVDGEEAPPATTRMQVTGSTNTVPPEVLAAAPPDVPMSMIELEDGAPSGDYVLEYGARAGELGIVVTVKVPQSPIELAMRASAHQVLLGGEGTVDVTLQDAGTGFDGDVVATLHKGGVELESLSVASLGNGSYRVDALDALDANSEPGVYNIYVRASGVRDGRRFDRYGWTGFHFVIPTARFVEAAEPRLVEDDGVVTAIEVPVELEITGRDRYELNGTLVWVDEDGVAHPVARAQVADGLDEGDHTLTLRFDAGHVGLLNKDADFELRELTLYSQTQHGTFHRLAGGLGLEVYVPASRTAEPEMTPALELLIHEGGYAL